MGLPKRRSHEVAVFLDRFGKEMKANDFVDSAPERHGSDGAGDSIVFSSGILTTLFPHVPDAEETRTGARKMIVR